MNERESRIEHEKPPLFYHASPNRNIERLEPRAEKVRDETEGPVVFATPDIRIALPHLLDWTDAWGRSGQINGVPFMVFNDREKFRERDKGGTLYTLPNDSFYEDHERQGRRGEWVSREAVVPIEKVEYPSTLEAMLDNGIQVYFVDQDTFDQIEKSDDHGLKILRSLESENQKLGRNAVEIPEGGIPPEDR